MLDVSNPILTYRGVEYELEMGTVEHTFIGFEDHGLYSLNLGFEFGGSDQGTGHYMMGKEGEALGYTVHAILKVVGANQWEKLVGSSVYVVRAKGDRFGSILGLVSRNKDRIVLFEDLFKK